MTSFNLSTWAVRHGALVGFFAVVLCLAGLDSFLKLGRSEDPSYAIKVVNVVSLWPGASAQQMRDQVADPIEEKLQTIPYFDRIDTYATPGYLAMQVWVKDYTPPAEVPESFYQLRKKLQDMAGTLPDGVQGPFVDDEFGDVDSVLLAIKGEGAIPHDLERIADQLQIALLRHSEISRVRTYGRQPRQVLVEYDDARTGTLGVPPGAITAALADFTRLHDAGTLDDGAQRLRISFAGDEGLARAIGAVSIPVGQSVLRLDDLARVSIGYPSPPSQMVRHDGQDAVILGVVMAPRENLSRIDAIVTETLAEARLPQGIEVTRVADQPAVAAHAIREFLTAFVEALAIVLAVCLVVLGWRTGIIVALSVPIVLAATFIVMRAMGIELHRVSLGALIIALGLLVDDAIIAIESMVRGIEAGKSRHEAVSMAWNSTAFPMLTGTLVTFIGFMPVGFAPSSTGEYLASLSWVIAIALIASWLVAVMLTPWLGVHLLPSQGRRHPPRIRRWQEALNATLGRTVGWAVDHYGRVIATIAVLFVLAGLGFVTVQKQFFPLSERVDLFVQLRLPQGSSIAQTSAAATEVEQFLAADPDATSVTTYIGQGPPRFWLALNPALPNPSYAELVVLGRDIAARERLKARLEAALSQGLAGAARARVIRFSFGPPVAYQVEFRISGAKPEELRRIGNEVRRIMAQDPRMTDPHLNWNERSPTLQLSLEPDRMRLFGLTFADVAARLQTAVGGARAGVLRDRDESLDVIVRAAGAAQSDPCRPPRRQPEGVANRI